MISTLQCRQVGHRVLDHMQPWAFSTATYQGEGARQHEMLMQIAMPYVQLKDQTTGGTLCFGQNIMLVWGPLALTESSYLCIIQFALPLLVQALVFVPPVPEGPHSAHIEVVFPHADTCLPHLTSRLVQHPLVHLPINHSHP